VPDSTGFTLWFTGLSGSGKSTVSHQIVKRLQEHGRKVELLDGDIVRTNLSQGLGFQKADRDTNVQRIGFVCELLSRNGVIAVVAAISPYREARAAVKRRVERFVEVYVECPVSVLLARDVKGLYKRALAGEIPHFTGVSDPYEPPEEPDLTIHSDQESVAESIERVWVLLQERELISID
jgi:adenylyl-sulfate kinase